MITRKRRLVWDIETDGLLHQLTRIHCLIIRDLDSRQTWRFRKNDVEDTIQEGIALLNDADLWVGHNLVGFDIYAMEKVFPGCFDLFEGTVRDTLVMARMLFSDVKEGDFRLWKRGDLAGELIGSQTLEAWGARLGFPKDDYSKRRKVYATELWNADPSLADAWPDLKAFIKHHTWDYWTQELDDYGVQDLDPTEALWLKIERVEVAEDAVKLEHMICDLMARVEQNGFNFNSDAARVLQVELTEEFTHLTGEAIEHFGKWMAAGKWLVTDKSTGFLDPSTNEKVSDGRTFAPRPEFGEDDTRSVWGEVTVPKRSIRFKPELVAAKGGDKEAGCAYCPVVLKEFNPNSRPMIVDRLTKVYEWEPQEFTEKNNPIVNDEVLRDLSDRIPICESLAEIFYYKKRLGQVCDGAEAWLNVVHADGRIHGRINPGGTVTNRATHSKPNIAQVPRVVSKKLAQWIEPDVGYKFVKGKIVYGLRDENGKVDLGREPTPLLGPNGKQIIGKPKLNKDGSYILDDKGEVVTKAEVVHGRAGLHGHDCRNLFGVPEGWVMLGADQKGIELRALAHAMWEFDGGAYAELLLKGDVHQAHADAMEIDRNTAKTFIYALLYGAADFKLGITINPSLMMYPAKAKALGGQMRERLMSRFPALKKLTKAVQKTAGHGYVLALDGRKLNVRAKHAALNTLLQGMGATLAKIWAVSFEAFMEEEGFVHGWDGDYAILAWVHDELQIALRDDPRVIEAAQRLIEEAATYSGERVDFKLAVEIDTKLGRTWSDTH